MFAASATHLHDARRSQPPDSGFSEPINNNISEDNNNGPISLREMQNIANNNAAAYIVSENEERNRVRQSVVEFEPLPNGIRVADPLEHCADWFGECSRIAMLYTSLTESESWPLTSKYAIVLSFGLYLSSTDTNQWKNAVAKDLEELGVPN